MPARVARNPRGGSPGGGATGGSGVRTSGAEGGTTGKGGGSVATARSSWKEGAHSYRNASIGSSRAALTAGQSPKVRPTITEVTKAITTQVGCSTAGKGENLSTSQA